MDVSSFAKKARSYLFLVLLLNISVSASAQEVRTHRKPTTPSVKAVSANGSGNSDRPSISESGSDIEDPLSVWFEENAEAFGLYVEEPPPQVIQSAEVFPKPPPRPLRVEQKKKNRKVFAPPAAAIAAKDAAGQIKAVMDDLKFGGTCDAFATEKGFGPWGQAVIDSLKRGNGEALLKGPADLRRACPNYENLGIEERSYVWVKVFAAMSFKESTCNPQARRPGIKQGRWARGILQLHEDNESTYSKSCSIGDSRTATRSLRCSISMLNNQVEKSGALFYKKTHWGVLRPQGDLLKLKNGKKVRVNMTRLTIGALQELPLCQRRTLPTVTKTAVTKKQAWKSSSAF